MARQPPTLEDIALPGVQGARPVAGYDVSAFGQGAQALARSGQTLGTDIQKSAQDIAQVRTYRAHAATLLAQDNALGEAIQLREKYKHDTDYETLPDRYQADLDAIAQKHLSAIPEGPFREKAQARLQVPFAHEIASVADQAFKAQANDFRAGLVDESDQLINTMGAQNDPLHAAKVTQFGAKVQFAKDKGFLTPMEAELLSRKTGRGIYDAGYRARFRASPADAAAAIKELEEAQTGAGAQPGAAQPGAVMPVDNAARVVATAETGDAALGYKAIGNISRDSKGSKSYGFTGLNSLPGGSVYRFVREYGDQFGLRAPPGTPAFDAQWKAASLDQSVAFRDAQLKDFKERNLAPVHDSLQSLGIPQEVASDPRVVTYFADRHVQMGNLGLNASADAWRTSNGDVPTFLRNMNDIDRRNLQSNFQSAIATGVYGPAGHETRLNTRLNGALAAGGEQQSQTGTPQDVLTPAHRDTLIREGRTILRNYDADDERARRDQERQQKELSDNTEAAIVHDLHGPNPSTTAEGLYDNYIKKGLSREAYERMLNLYETRNKAADKEDHDAKTYGTAFLPLMERIHPQDGHLAPVTDPSQITDFYIQNPDQLTFAGHEKLVGMINANRKSLDDHAANTTRTGLLNYAKSKLSFDQTLLFPGVRPLRDPKGEAIFNAQFIPKFESGYDTWVKAGKNPWEYLTKKNVDSMLEGMRSQSEMNASFVAEKGEATGEVGAPPQEQLPPTPEGVNPAGWVPIISKPPHTASGKPWPVSNWAAMIEDLRGDPTDEKKQAFDARFGKFGITADEVLGKLTQPVTTEEAAEPPTTTSPTPSYSIHDTAGPGPAGYVRDVLGAVTPKSVKDYVASKGAAQESAAEPPGVTFPPAQSLELPPARTKDAIEDDLKALNTREKALKRSGLGGAFLAAQSRQIAERRAALMAEKNGPALDHDAHAEWRDGR